MSHNRAAKAKAKPPVPIWSADLLFAQPPAWMIELAKQVGMIEPDADLPTGVIVGSAVIDHVSQYDDGMYQWHLAGVKRATTFRKPKKHPQPVWFNPF